MPYRSVNPCRVLSSPSFSLSSSLSSSLVLSSFSVFNLCHSLSLSVSVSPCLCLRVVLWSCCCGVSWCVMLCCVVSCGAVWCVVCGVWCVSVQNVPMCPSKTSPCVPAPRAHVETHVRVVPAYTGTFWTDTRGEEGGVRRQPSVLHR